MFIDNSLKFGVRDELASRRSPSRCVSVSRNRSEFLMWFIAEKVDSHAHVLPNKTRNFCAIVTSGGNLARTFVPQKSTTHVAQNVFKTFISG